MARLSYGTLHFMQNKILKDLYETHEKKLNERRADISRRNREYTLAPLMEYIEKLPTELVHKTWRYHTHIEYNTDQPDPLKKLREDWIFKGDSIMINPPEDHYRKEPYSVSKLVPELYKEAKELCEDIIALRNEKNTLKRFLAETITKYKGSLQLREVWPETLHKYLPAEPAKGGKPRKPPKVEKLEKPTFIKQRLTTNLLEE